jgi:chromosome segregation ATPase
LAVLFFAFFFSVAGISWAQSSPNPPDPNVSPVPSGNWWSLDQLLTELESEASGQAEDLRKLLVQLEESRTALSESSSLLGQSEAQLKSLTEAMMNEREQAHRTLMLAIDKGARAENSRDRWRTAGIVGICISVIEAITIGLIVAAR